jgi:hypothetical protein
MTWLDDADKELKAIKDRKRLIAEQQNETYESLWRELKTHFDEAKGKSFPELFINGQQFSRSIKLPVDPIPPAQQSSPREVIIALSKTEHAIVVSGAVTLRLDIDVCDNGVVCLKQDGNEMQVEDAAIAILRSFLYPELYPAAAAAKRTSRLI